MANPSGQIVNTCYSDGLRVSEMWCKLFRENEVNFKEGRHSLVLVDERLTDTMLTAFPDRFLSAVMRQVRKHRAAYNRGVYTAGSRPFIQSRRYIRKDDDTVTPATARGKELSRNLKNIQKGSRQA